MKKYLILILVLVIPSVGYLLLQTGHNDFHTLEILGPKDPVVKTIDGRDVVDTVYHTIGAFSLTDADSNQITDAVMNGKICVVDFFFTTCKTICPKMSNQLMRVQHKFRDRDDVNILSFTVDPLNDTPFRLREYALKHKALPGKWHFITGEKDSIYNLAKTSFFLTAMEGGGGSDAFLHSDQFLLIDKKRRIRGYYDGTDHLEVKKLIEDINVLTKAYADGKE